jgi:molybdate transport system ATP-binding protein
MTAALEVDVQRRIHAGLALDVKLKIEASECGVVFGPSGAGKTSLLRVIAGLDRPDTGVVRLADEAIVDRARHIDVPMRARRVGMIFQDDLLFPHRDVAGNIGFGLKGWPRTAVEARMAEIAVLCGVDRLFDRAPETLSGGERQRVGLARALAPRPRLLLCDEPVSALDLDGRQILLERLKMVQRAERIPFLYVTHAPDEAVFLGDRLFQLEHGIVVAEGPPLDVLAARRGAGDALAGLRNILAGTVVSHAAGETIVRLRGGPELVVPSHDLPLGTALSVTVRADDILLARGPISGLSARNILAGTVDRILPHGDEAEVVLNTGAVSWIVSVVRSAVAALDLRRDSQVYLIIKARSCRVSGSESR